MTIYKARRYAMLAYILGAVLLFLGMLMFPEGAIRYFLYMLALVAAAYGFRTAYRYCRCPRCGHVLQLGFMRMEKCQHCGCAVDENSTCFRY